MRTPAYVQVVGFIDQRFIDMVSDDSGGELGMVPAILHTGVN
jgi:hypothetical protein